MAHNHYVTPHLDGHPVFVSSPPPHRPLTTIIPTYPERSTRARTASKPGPSHTSGLPISPYPTGHPKRPPMSAATAPPGHPTSPPSMSYDFPPSIPTVNYASAAPRYADLPSTKNARRNGIMPEYGIQPSKIRSAKSAANVRAQAQSITPDPIAAPPVSYGTKLRARAQSAAPSSTRIGVVRDTLPALQPICYYKSRRLPAPHYSSTYVDENGKPAHRRPSNRPVKHTEGHSIHQFIGQVPYPTSHDRVVLDAQAETTRLLTALADGRPSFWNFGKRPPVSVLDLGCGDGTWILEVKKVWRHSRFTGFDMAPVQKDTSSSRVTWMQGNCLRGLPFPAKYFDFVRVAFVSLGVSCTEWPKLMAEIQRVMTDDGILEIIDEDVMLSPKNPTRSTARVHHNLRRVFQDIVYERHLNEAPLQLPRLLGHSFQSFSDRQDFQLALVASLPPSPDVSSASIKRSTHSRSTSAATSSSASSTSETTGLVLLPDTLIRMSAADASEHATNLSHVIFGATPWIREHLLTRHTRLDGQPPDMTLDDVVESYQKDRFRRIGVEDPFKNGFDSEDEDEEREKDRHYRSHSRGSSVMSVLSFGLLGKKKGVEFGKKVRFEGEAGVVVRRFSVWHARGPKPAKTQRADDDL